MPEKFEDFFATRHSVKPKGEDIESKEYPGISEKGVELARERARSILESLEKAEEGTVMFIGGVSEMVRTRSTARVFGEEIKRTAEEKGRENLMILTQKDIIDREKGYSQTVKEVAERIKANPDKKILIDFPLFLKEFGLGLSRWRDKEGNDTPYIKELKKRNENDFTACLKDWIENKGQIGDLQGPNPTRVAEEQLEGIKRLREFAQKHIGERPLIIGTVGHAWNLDALTIYLANEGKVDLEGFEKVGGEVIGEAEMTQVEIDKKGAKLNYKGKEYPIELEEKSEE